MSETPSGPRDRAGPAPVAGGPGGPAEPPQAAVERRSRFSLVWVIPILALLVGGWLAWDAISSRGPSITIVFETGEGIEAGKTKVKYRDIQIGLVQEVMLAEDLSHVEVTAELEPGSARFLREGTRFWVTRARISAGEVQGLQTLLSGAYIGIDPVTEGKSQRRFDGLERPPAVTYDRPGRRFTLRSETLGSIEVGAPVHFRGIHVGEVVDWELAESGEYVTIWIFVNAPHHERVSLRTRFWNESGFDMQVGADGVRIDTQSLVSILVGGIAFDSRASLLGPARRRRESPVRRPVPEGHTFPLYPSRQATRERSYSLRERYVLEFEHSVEGLSAGAPVVFRGLKVGEVLDVRLEFDPDVLEFSVPVLIEVHPERVRTSDGEPLHEVGSMPALVERGLRARLARGNLLTGQRQVELGFFPEVEPVDLAALQEGEGPPRIPTLPTPLDEAASSVERILAKLEAVPFDDIGRQLDGALAELRTVLEDTGDVAEQLHRDLAPRLEATLAKLEEAAASAASSLDDDSPTRRELERTLVELGDAARSLRSLAEYLERHPESLLRGKEAE